MSIIDFSASEAFDETEIPAILEAVRGAQEPPSLLLVTGMGKTKERLLEAGERSAAQDLVLASTMAEGTRTRYMQVAQELTKQPLRKETESLLSDLFEELTKLLEGIYLVGELGPRGRLVLGSYGERATSLIVAQALRQEGLQAQTLGERQVYLATHAPAGKYGEQAVREFQEQLAELSRDGILAVIPGSLRSSAGK